MPRSGGLLCVESRISSTPVVVPGEDLLAVDGHPVAADASDLQAVRPRLGESQHGAQCDAVRLGSEVAVPAPVTGGADRAADAVAVGVEVVGAYSAGAGVGVGEERVGEVRRAQTGVAAAVHGQVHVLGERGAQPVLERHRAHRRYVGAAAALEVRRNGVGADQGDAADALRRQRQQVGLVAEQHHAAGGDLTDEAEVVLSGARRGGGRRHRVLSGLAQAAGVPRQAQQPQHLVVDEPFVDLARVDGLHEGVAPQGLGSGHRQVEAADRRGHGRVGGRPVADHGPGETPLLLQHLAQQPGVLGHRRRLGAVVDARVGGHHAPRLGLGEHLLEGAR